VIYCKPRALSFAIRMALGMYTPGIAAQRTIDGKTNVFFI
jgi:hypothetical protein